MRRKSWSIAACLIGLLFTQLALAGANPLWAQYVPGPKLTIINKSGYPANQIYLVFLAIPYADDPNYHRILWPHDEFLAAFPPIGPDDNTVTVPGANNNPYADYSTTLDRLSKDANGNHYFYLPQGVTTGDDQGLSTGGSGSLLRSLRIFTLIAPAATHNPPSATRVTPTSAPCSTFLNPKSEWAATFTPTPPMSTWSPCPCCMN